MIGVSPCTAELLRVLGVAKRIAGDLDAAQAALDNLANQVELQYATIAQAEAAQVSAAALELALVTAGALEPASLAGFRGFELLRELDFLRQLMANVFGIPDFDPAQYRGLLFGLCMVIMMIFRPRGFVSTRSPSIFLKERKAVSGSLVKEGHG